MPKEKDCAASLGENEEDFKALQIRMCTCVLARVVSESGMQRR